MESRAFAVLEYVSIRAVLAVTFPTDFAFLAQYFPFWQM